MKTKTTTPYLTNICNIVGSDLLTPMMIQRTELRSYVKTNKGQRLWYERMHTYHIYSSLVNKSNFSSLIHPLLYNIAIDFQANIYSQAY